MPRGEVEFAKIAFVVERGQPVDSVDRTGRGPILQEAGQSVRVWSSIDDEDFNSLCAKRFCQRVGYGLPCRA